MALNDIITRQYSNFMGVDFRGGEVPYYHSPDSINMWRNYKDSDCIQTRPGMALLKKFDNAIFGLFFYKLDNEIQMLVHSGTKFYKVGQELTELYSGLNPKQSRSFIYDGIFYFLDGINFLKYDGTSMTSVEGTIPTTSYYMYPDGSTQTDDNLDADYIFQNINCLTPKQRNRFVSDGVSTVYHLNQQNIDQSPVQIEIQNQLTKESYVYTEGNQFTVDRAKGYINFKSAPSGDCLVYVLFSKTVDGLRSRILNCTISCEFDNRIFLAGNPDYPNAIFWCSETNPEYYAEDDRLEVGIDLAEIKTLIPGNNVLWAIKEQAQNTASVFYLTPTIDSNLGKYYNPVGGNVSLGCVSTGTNFNDDIVYFSRNGLEAINSSSMYSEQLLTHRSSFVDNRLVNQEDYKNLKLTEYQGYLMILINSKMYLADKRKKITTSSGNVEYEWFYWELPNNINYMTEYQGELYLGNNNGELYMLVGDNDNGEDIYSYWTTRADDFGYPSYTKTTNKKGGEVNLRNSSNSEIKVTTITDNVEKSTQTLSDNKGYAVIKIKNKKFYKIQYKFSSNKPFGIYSATIQGFLAGYLKR